MPVKGTTEIKSLAQSFNKMVDQLQRNETLRRNLVADVAHELRTPITALQANIYAILDDAYPMTKTEIAGLYDQIRMLSRLVKDLHELSQAESGLLPLDRHPIEFQRNAGGTDRALSFGRRKQGGQAGNRHPGQSATCFGR